MFLPPARTYSASALSALALALAASVCCGAAAGTRTSAATKATARATPVCSANAAENQTTRIARVDVAKYEPSDTHAREELRILRHASAPDRDRAILQHFGGDLSSSEQRGADKQLAAAVTAACKRRDVELSARAAVERSNTPLPAGAQRETALVAYRDVFSALFVRPNVSDDIVARALVGFDGLLPPDVPVRDPAQSPPAPNATPCPLPEAAVTIVQRVEPVFPEIAKAQGASAATEVKVTVDNLGNVQDVSVFKSADFAALDQSALQAARASRYAAAKHNCAASGGSYIFTANFGST